MTDVLSRGEMAAQIIQMAMAHGAGATFASFLYTAKGTGEVARHTLILNASTEVLYEKDLELLRAMLPRLRGIEKLACEKIIASREVSIGAGIGNNPDYAHGPHNRLHGTYVYPLGLKNIAVHKETGEILINGISTGKVIITPGEYKEVNSAPLTIAKRNIARGLPSGKFRQFALRKVDRARLRGDTLVLLQEGDADDE